jgi:hypothetical protein
MGSAPAFNCQPFAIPFQFSGFSSQSAMPRFRPFEPMKKSTQKLGLKNPRSKADKAKG